MVGGVVSGVRQDVENTSTFSRVDMATIAVTFGTRELHVPEREIPRPRVRLLCTEAGKSQRILPLINKEDGFSQLSGPQRHWFNPHVAGCESCRHALAMRLASPKELILQD